MRINSPADYLAALGRLAAIRRAWDAWSDLAWSKSTTLHLPKAERDAGEPPVYEAEEGEIERAVRGYLRGLTSEQGRKVAGTISDDDLRDMHSVYFDQIEREHLTQLARLSGIRNKPGSDRELKSQALAGYLVGEQYIQNQKRRIKEQGRIVRCEMCTIDFHSADTERIKPYGSTRYGRFCKPCADKVKSYKAIYQGLRQGRRKKA